MKTTKEFKTNIQTWIDALRSGKYKQTTDLLEDRLGLCCLGVACKIFIPVNDQITHLGLLVGLAPIGQRNADLWLKEIDERFQALTGKSLSYLNDTLLLTFDEIADVLQAVYIEEVLK